MIGKSREAVIQEDTVIKGHIRNCDRIEVRGYVEGELEAGMALVQNGGKVYGTLRADNAEIHGVLQGEVFVRHLIKIGSDGAVTGNVQYGQIAMDLGGELSAKLHNVPPEIAGDLDITVEKGKSVGITLVDLQALDPDDKAHDLTFSVTKANHGFIALSKAPKKAVNKFTQADLEAGQVLFVHDGTGGSSASFDVIVTDSKGATSGAAKTVNVNVRT